MTEPRDPRPFIVLTAIHDTNARAAAVTLSHADAWERAHASLGEAETALRSHGHTGSCAQHFVALIDGVSVDERVAILRTRLGRLLALPDKARHAALAELARVSVELPDHGLGVITAELTVLTELPNENLEAASRLEQTTELAEYLLEQVQTCLQSLSQALLDERKKYPPVQ